MRRAWAVALGAAAMIVIAVTWRVLSVGPVVGPTVAVVERLEGEAWQSPGDRVAVALVAGEALRAGCELTTDGGGRAALRLMSGHSIRLDRETHVHLLDARTLAIERGALYVASEHATGSASGIRLKTPLGEIREVGTQFEARLSSRSLRVRLREGAVVVRGDGGSHAVEAGTELELRADGSVTQKPISGHGSEWAWVADITPMPDFAGRSAREFLDWVARENGWKLAFSDPTVARAAAVTVLGGTPRRVSPEAALDAVLPTCRMIWSVETGVLRVSPAPT
jgi:ferric-dicitrate binding protein FerR (iron transport regulator)